jgi:hypothetical protein
MVGLWRGWAKSLAESEGGVPGEYYFAGGGVRIDFTPNTAGPGNVGLGDVQQGNFVNGEWVVARQIAGDDDAQGEILILRPYTILRVTLYRFP